MSSGFPRTIFRVPVALADFLTQVFQHGVLPALSRRAMMRKPSCLISWSQPGPEGGAFVGDGRHGSIMPSPGRLRICNMRGLIGGAAPRVESAISPYAPIPAAWRYSPRSAAPHAPATWFHIPAVDRRLNLFFGCGQFALFKCRTILQHRFTRGAALKLRYCHADRNDLESDHD